MTTYGLYGAGGYGREVRRLVLASLEREMQAGSEVVFIDDAREAQGHKIHGSRVLSIDEFLDLREHKQACVTFANSTLRQKKTELLDEAGIELFSVVAPTTILGHNMSTGGAAIFSDHTMVTCDATIGRSFHCNIYSYVAHDCVVGDYVTFAPRVSLNGRVVVGDHAYIGSDATILPGNPDEPLTIGEGAVVGAGAVVTKDVEPFTTVVGAPARPIGATRQ